MAYWLLKSEPDEYSIDDLRTEPTGNAVWDGIRNYQARNILRDQVRVGDQAFFYHSSCSAVGIAGTVKVVRSAYPDPAQFLADHKYYDPKATPDAPRWYCIDISFGEKFDHLLPLAAIKQHPGLADMVLVKQGRLSVQPVTSEQWRLVCEQCHSVRH